MTSSRSSDQLVTGENHTETLHMTGHGSEVTVNHKIAGLSMATTAENLYSTMSIDVTSISNRVTANGTDIYWNLTGNGSLPTAPPPVTSRELSVVYIIIGALGIAGNLFVIIVVLASRALRKQTNVMFILNQSVLDLVVAVFLIAATTVESYQVEPGMILDGQLYCRLWLTKVPLWGTLCSSTYNLLALTVERYLAMIHPVWHKVNFNRRKAAAMLAFSWIFGLTYMTVYVYPTTVIVDGFCRVYDEWPSQQMRNVFGVLHAIIMFFIPLGSLIFCYGRIALMLRKRVKVNATAQVATNAGTMNMTQNASGQQPEDRWSSAHRNTIKTLMLVSSCFVLCWVWNQFYFMLMNFGIPSDYTSDFYHFTVIAVFVNCCVNPIIYSLKYEQFQRAARRLFLKRSQFGNSSNNASISTVTDHA